MGKKKGSVLERFKSKQEQVIARKAVTFIVIKRMICADVSKKTLSKEEGSQKKQDGHNVNTRIENPVLVKRNFYIRSMFIKRNI